MQHQKRKIPSVDSELGARGTSRPKQDICNCLYLFEHDKYEGPYNEHDPSIWAECLPAYIVKCNFCIYRKPIGLFFIDGISTLVCEYIAEVKRIKECNCGRYRLNEDFPTISEANTKRLIQSKSIWHVSGLHVLSRILSLGWHSISIQLGEKLKTGECNEPNAKKNKLDNSDIIYVSDEKFLTLVIHENPDIPRRDVPLPGIVYFRGGELCYSDDTCLQCNEAVCEEGETKKGVCEKCREENEQQSGEESS